MHRRSRMWATRSASWRPFTKLGACSSSWTATRRASCPHLVAEGARHCHQSRKRHDSQPNGQPHARPGDRLVAIHLARLAVDQEAKELVPVAIAEHVQRQQDQIIVHLAELGAGAEIAIGVASQKST